MKLAVLDEFLSEKNLRDQVEVINNLYEPSDAILKFTARSEVFMDQARAAVRTYEEFVELIRSHLLQLVNDTERVGPTSKDMGNICDIISSHPRLGENKNLSIHSQNEQKNLQKNRDSAEIQARLKELNEEYEKVYPGLKFIVFVNGRKRPEIIKLMEERVGSGNTWFEEARVAMNELCDIAQDRIKKWEVESLQSKY
ncbi:hypothetical protein HG535_0E04700 [Zygotorulaspora mrakii]|uniref:Oxo-4-hydroxy-4-carboxy-5-ureidoimidazoline decarboxylase domain-containing protein n=1 Tax=Zygotorulaspora mrakii TaxID=42260 RepID=A0A7H9B4T3_ZYGMR|nr:uncharacterized protein HG535_0E04700 [Zygotorulaspora mrakii]QLG73386.1 hypothetical protein HG535_0E04700 [Zygotorulaspora mrakii]